jgi:carbamoyl-phosphate synthase small subunit
MQTGAGTQSQPELVAALALEDGAVFYGRPFGAVDALAPGRRGEVVFATCLTGYQEICTDPSYRGQMVVLTYPFIGNYGVTSQDGESRRPWLSALLVRECCEEYSHWRAQESLDAYLARQGIPGMAELDTRALTRHLRTHGTQRGLARVFAAEERIDEAALVAEARTVRSISQLDVVGEVSISRARPWEPSVAHAIRSVGGRPQARHATGPLPPRTPEPSRRPRVVLVDTGYKENIARCLAERGLDTILVPHDVDLPQLRRLDPDGILLANGPGDPESEEGLVALVRELLHRRERIPLLGICLGHQILGLAAGATTSRLPFGHHGANHPVLEKATGRVTITSQNHNFQVDEASLPPEGGLVVSHVNLSDGSVEALEHTSLPVFSVQYHPEAHPGPEDNRAVFDRFAEMIRREISLREREALLVG